MLSIRHYCSQSKNSYYDFIGITLPFGAAFVTSQTLLISSRTNVGMTLGNDYGKSAAWTREQGSYLPKIVLWK